MIEVDIKTLRELLDCDPATGTLTWRPRGIHWFEDGTNTAASSQKTWNTRYAGQRAFTARRKDGYLCGRILKKTYRAHRVVWALYFGEWPTDQIDHINGKYDDNRISNLRTVSHAENGRNQKLRATNNSGHMGVHFDKARGKWIAFGRHDGKMHNLGRFVKKSDAIRARMDFERKFHFHENHGRS